MEKNFSSQNILPLQDPPRIQKLGAYLKKLRHEMGFSLRDVSAHTDLSPGYISKIENGAIKKTIGIEPLVSLANIYEIPIEVILSEAEFTAKSSQDLPPLGMYLKLKYKFSPQAIRDIEIAKEIVERKYKRTT